MKNQKNKNSKHSEKKSATPQVKHLNSWKPGSDPAGAAKVESKGDFGVPEGTAPSLARDYASKNTRASDPGAAQPLANEMLGNRTAGAGAKYSGPGSGSGGDLDTDIIGVGTGSGIAASGKVHEAAGPDDSDGSSDVFASGPKAKGTGRSGRKQTVRGSTVSPASESDFSGGADSATNPARGDDSAAGEISSGEARGEDN